MLKKLTGLFLLAFLLVFGLAQTAQASLGDPLLKYGSTGSDVVQLQTELNYLGYNVGTADGIFGSKTKAGVMAFQTAESLSVDGIVGPITASSLNKAYTEKQQSSKTTAIIATAEKYLGVPYQWGGESPTTGFDCSGFVQYVFSQNGITLPRVSQDQYTVGTPVSFSDLQPGDLIFFSIAKNGVEDHDGIYIGNDQFINASSSKGVTIYTIGPYWTSVYLGARRVL
ncbi:cell wall-associated hydrolase, invasion-associated protein [Desulfosporosinus acidiphilus SJ4]|uniref:Cell wall-associated hydrolase, invasion-associated protein n=1 Tax=Desulfosporosinus acidiphilus (strain DSM 22704 / JCM 16185 / SJ4) TaxID=646529 RepID=I4D4I4_DESAJ|nr:NlpC/P60 family protein [Desulfosporosinus acidiphilus]AFM40708.1 cell wall-associated hydrolase, invasion-associated protein [Desulfosporosinus acidiphilus SJ4]